MQISILRSLSRLLSKRPDDRTATLRRGAPSRRRYGLRDDAHPEAAGRVQLVELSYVEACEGWASRHRGRTS